MMDFIMPILLSELLMPVISFIMAAIVAWAAKLWRDFTGAEIEARHRDAFQTSLENAARLLIMRYGPILPGKEIPRGLLNEGLNYVKTGSPDAIKHFGVRDDTIVERLIPHFLSGAIDLITRR